MTKHRSGSFVVSSSGKGGPLVDVVPESFDAVSLKRLLHSLAVGVLVGRITPRAASTVRGLIRCWLTIDEHQRLDAIEERLGKIEAAKEGHS